VDLSAKEELDPQNVALSEKVDKLMETEIRRFHAACAAQNIKKWEALGRRIQGRREAIAAAIRVFRLICIYTSAPL